MPYITPTNYNRAVNTGFEATPAMVDLFRSILGQMSDGYWENNSTMCKYWNNARIKVINNCISIMVNAEPDYAIAVRCRGHYNRRYEMFYPNPFHKMSDVDIKKFFGKALRTIINAQIRTERKNGVLASNRKPHPEFHMDYLGYTNPAVTYKLVTCIRDLLLECDK